MLFARVPAKGLIRKWMSSSALAMCLVGMGAPASAQLVLGNGNDYKPFADEALENGGLVTQIVTESAAIVGVDVTFRFQDWSLGEAQARKGELDGTTAYYYTEERDDFFAYTDTIYDIVRSLFMRIDAPILPTSVEEIGALTICNPSGYATPADIMQIAKKIEVPADMTRCFELLQQGRVDAVLVDALQGWDLVKSTPGLDDLNVLQAPWDIEVNTHSVIMSHLTGSKACQMVARLNGGMALMRRNGRYDEIVETWLGPTGEHAKLDEVYTIELADKTRIRGRPRSYQRGVFIIDTVGGTQEIVPAADLAIFRREGYPRFDRDDQECRNAEATRIRVEALLGDSDHKTPIELPLRPELTVAGSSALAETFMPALVEAFAKKDDLNVSVGREDQSGGTAVFRATGVPVGRPSAIAVVSSDTQTGFDELVNGETDLVLADRRALPSEVSKALALGDLSHPSAERVLALEAFAVVVNTANPYAYVQTGFDLDALEKVATGTYSNWSRLGFDLGPITFAAAPGTSDILSVPVTERDVDEVLSLVAADPKAVGIVPLSAAAADPKVSMAKLSTCDAEHSISPFAVKTEEYPLVRRLISYLPPRNTNRFAGEFIAFAESAEGQSIVETSGAVGLNIAIQPKAAKAAAIDDIVRRQASAQIENAVLSYRQLALSGLRVSTTFRFRGGSDQLDPRAIEDARRLVKFLREAPDLQGRTVTLVGFADSRGGASFNQELAKRRAKSVARQLSLEGHRGASVMAVGEDLAVACNTTEDGRSLNRRVEVWLR